MGEVVSVVNSEQGSLVLLGNLGTFALVQSCALQPGGASLDNAVGVSSRRELHSFTPRASWVNPGHTDLVEHRSCIMAVGVIKELLLPVSRRTPRSPLPVPCNPNQMRAIEAVGTNVPGSE